MGYEEPPGFPLTLVVSHVDGWKDSNSRCPSPGSLMPLNVESIPSQLHWKTSPGPFPPPLSWGGLQGSSSALTTSGWRKNPCFLGVIFLGFDFPKLARFGEAGLGCAVIRKGSERHLHCLSSKT